MYGVQVAPEKQHKISLRQPLVVRVALVAPLSAPGAPVQGCAALHWHQHGALGWPCVLEVGLRLCVCVRVRACAYVSARNVHMHMCAYAHISMRMSACVYS